VQGRLRGERIKKSLDLRNWDAAQKLVRDWEAGGTVSVPIATACERFEADCKARGLGVAQLGKYKLLTDELKTAFGNRTVSAVSIDDLRAYRESWEMSPVSAGKKLERLRTFFKFCNESGWIATNPAKILKAPKVKQKPTIPFTDQEIEKILWATEIYPIQGIHGKNNRTRLRAFVNLLRYSGLRIRDAVTLSKDKIKDNKLLLYTQKTGTPVWLPLPESVVVALVELNPSSEYFFWTGNGLPKSAVADWQRALAKLFTLAGIKGHAHKFRDYFSVKLLESGVSLETVSILLGHSSIRITEKHYAPWVKSRQLKLEESIERAWKL
jgi:integrase/recombinase XerD